jgi:hypothetical protein
MNAGTTRRCDCGQDLSALAAESERQSQAKVAVTTQAEAHQQAAREELRRCPKCGGLMETGFLYSIDSVGEMVTKTCERIGWMAGNAFETSTEKVLWVLPVITQTNPRREMTASRCPSCALVELYAR